MRERTPGGALTSVPPEEGVSSHEDDVPSARASVPEDALSQTLVGHVVAGRFRLSSLLGEGGMGAVFEAEDLELGRRVAVKVLTEVAVREPSAIARFVREARAAAAIASEHIVEVFDIGEDAEVGLYVVMELLDGEDLGARIARSGKLGAEEVIVIASQIALALDAAHHQGVIHRDLKPQNVFLCARPDGKLAVKVVDFGIAKLARDTRRSSRGAITRSGMAVGTPQYMSPEQAQVMIVDARADVYALGAVVYEMLVGVPPVPLLPYEQTIVHIVLKGAARLLPAPSVPAPLSRLVNEMLASRKDDRPGSAGEVYTRLDALAHELGVADRVPRAEVRRSPTAEASEIEVGEAGASSRRPPLRRRSTRGPRERRALPVEGVPPRGDVPDEHRVPAAAPLETEADVGERMSVVEPLVGRAPLLVVAVSLGLLLVLLGARDLIARRRGASVTEAATSMTAWPTSPEAPAATETTKPAATTEPPVAPSAALPVAPPALASAPASAAPAPPKSTGSRIGDARLALERGDTSRAVALAKDALATDPHRGDAWLVLGAAHEMAGRTAEARAAYTECAEHGHGRARAECADLLSR